MRVLSLFDGISCGQVALERAGIPVEVYYASEIDKYAIQVTMKNYPNTIQLGDVTKLDGTQFKGKIDLLIGGSPCQSLSIAMGKDRQNLDGKSKLFYEYVRILEEVQPKYFLLENVESMSDECKYIMSEKLGCKPLMIDSNLFSAQDRPRYYWFNWGIENKDLFSNSNFSVPYPKDKGLVLKDIMEENVEEKFFYDYKLLNIDMNKQVCATLDFKNNDIHKRVFNPNFKVHTLTCCRGGNTQKKVYDNGKARKLTPLEYERLQTLPDGYTELGTSYYYYNIYDIINMVIKGEQLCKNVKLKDAKILSQTEKQGYAINIIYDISDMEQQNLQEILLNEKKSVLLMDAITSNKQERDIVLNTIRDIKEQVQQNLIKMNLKNVNIAIDWQLQEECVIGTIKIGYNTEMQNIQIKLEKEQIITDIKNLKENIEYNIEKLLQKYWGEIYHLKKLYTILIWINLIMIKKIYMCVIKMNTQAYISSLIELQGNSLKLELSNLKMVDIIPISSTQRYNCIGNGWTVDVVSYIFSFLKKRI